MHEIKKYISFHILVKTRYVRFRNSKLLDRAKVLLQGRISPICYFKSFAFRQKLFLRASLNKAFRCSNTPCRHFQQWNLLTRNSCFRQFLLHRCYFKPTSYRRLPITFCQQIFTSHNFTFNINLLETFRKTFMISSSQLLKK